MKIKAPINVEVDGIPFASCCHYYDDQNQRTCHNIKDGLAVAIQYAAAQISHYLPKDGSIVLVPVPGHTGKATEALRICQYINEYTGIPIADVITGESRESNYKAKKNGHPLKEEDLGFKLNRELPLWRHPVVIDAVADTGVTAKAAVHAIGKTHAYGCSPSVMTFAATDNLIQQDKIQVYKQNIRQT